MVKSLFGKKSSGSATRAGQSHTQQGKKTTTSRADWLASRPLRNPQLEWHEENGVVVLRIIRTNTWKTRLLNLLVPLPSEKRVALDKIGTDVWLMMDGERRVGEIAKALAKKYQIDGREAELSLQQFFKELGRRGYVGFWVEDAATKDTPKKRKKS